MAAGPVLRSAAIICLTATVTGVAALADIAPAVYWRASPVAPGQATLFAGAFGPAPSVRLCSGSVGCTSWSPVPLLDGWNYSVKFEMPTCDGPCRFQFCAAPTGPCSDVADPNVPDVWFTMPSPPLLGTTFSPSLTGASSVVVNGPEVERSLLRVAGRALAFVDNQCVFAGARQTVPSTLLVLNASISIAADNATCFEATFDLSAALLGADSSFPGAALVTPYGSFPLPITVAPAVPPAPVSVIDVDAQAGGNVSAALAQAAQLPGFKIVLLGPGTYAQNAPLIVPNNTVLAGQGSGTSVLTFELPSSGPTPSATLSGAGDNWGLRDFSLSLLDAPAKTPAVWMPPETTNFTALRVNITLLQVRQTV
jgi:hypothetical protein